MSDYKTKQDLADVMAYDDFDYCLAHGINLETATIDGQELPEYIAKAQRMYRESRKEIAAWLEIDV